MVESVVGLYMLVALVMRRSYRLNGMLGYIIRLTCLCLKARVVHGKRAMYPMLLAPQMRTAHPVMIIVGDWSVRCPPMKRGHRMSKFFLGSDFSIDLNPCHA